MRQVFGKHNRKQHDRGTRSIKRVAITGGVGCGKSTLAEILNREGCEIWDADEAVHALEASGGKLCETIRRNFGEAVMAPDGAVDRRALARQVFGDSTARKRLETIVHPPVRRELRKWLATPGGGKTGIKVAVIPLLFEAGWHKGWDAILCVVCPETEQERRLLARGWTVNEARERIAAHWPQWRKAQAADVVFETGVHRKTLRQQALKWIEKLLEQDE